MKIGIITPAWPGTQTANGITTAVYHLAHGLRASGHEVVALSFAQDGPQGEVPVVLVPRRRWTITQKFRGKLEHLTGRDGVAMEVRAIRIAEAVEDAQRRHGLDVVLIEETQGSGGYLQRRIDIPVVITLHGPWFLHKALQSRGTEWSDSARERREAAALRTAAGITAPSHDVLMATQTELRLPPDIPQAVIRNPIPLAENAKVDSSNAIDGSDLLFIGRFDRHKGGDTILAAFAILARTHAAASLTFVGPDRGLNQKEGKTRHIKDVLSGLAPEVHARIRCLGQRNAAEIEDLRCRHAVTVIASRYENLNYTMLEAMAHGAALVATKVGGPAELLQHEETALLVPPDDPQAMAAACARLLDDPELRSRLGCAAQDVIRREFQPTVVGAQMASFLESIVAYNPNGRRSAVR